MSSYSLHVVLLSRLGPNDGGTETWLYNFLPRLVMRDENLFVKVFGISDEGAEPVASCPQSIFSSAIAPRFVLSQFPVYKRRYPVFFQMWRRLWSYTWSKGFKPPDFVMGVGIFELVMILTGRYSGSKKILWLRGIFLHEKARRFPPCLRPFLGWAVTFMLRRVDMLLANGEDIADHYRRQGLKVRVIENGVDFERWRCDKPRIVAPLHVAFVGRLTEVKGIEEFLAVVRAVKSGPNADQYVFHVVGIGPYACSPKFTESRNLFEYHGAVSNASLPMLLARFDICVALTLSSENLGGGGTSNALLEQMAAGRVIIAWDNPIFRQVINDESGYLVPQGDVEGIVHVLDEILVDGSRASAKALNAMEEVVERYSIDRQVTRYLKLIESNFP